MSEELMLARHGTRAYVLTPSAVLMAAKSDLAARRSNQALSQMQAGPGEFHPYAFLSKHVRAATSPSHLILLALTVPADIMKTTKPNTVRIYSDVGTLVDALTLADQEIAGRDKIPSAGDAPPSYAGVTFPP